MTPLWQIPWVAKDIWPSWLSQGSFARNVRKLRRLQEPRKTWAWHYKLDEQNYVSQTERGERSVSIDNMGSLADALGVPLQRLGRSRISFKRQKNIAVTPEREYLKYSTVIP